MELSIYSYKENKEAKIINTMNKEIVMLNVILIDWSELLIVYYKDGTREIYDSGVDIGEIYYDGGREYKGNYFDSYIVLPEEIEKWQSIGKGDKFVDIPYDRFSWAVNRWKRMH